MKDREDFIKKATEKHGNKYDYSLVEYISNSTKVKIVCPIHGEFEQIPESHYICGCPKCAGNIQKTTEEFIRDAKKVHGDRYNYEKSNYSKAFDKLTIICPEHGDFKQTPDAHVNARNGCPYCGSGGTYSEWYFRKTPHKKELSAIVYIIEMSLNDERFIKVGVSIKSAHIRSRSPSRNGGYSIDILKEIKMSLYEAWKLEQEILGRFKDEKYIPEIYFPGHTECLNIKVKEQLLTGK